MITRRRRRQGFTILEILIAIVVLVLGIMGIIALFPTAIESGNKTVEDSYAAAITQSVVDSITVGLRESRYQTSSSTHTPGFSYTYFVFNHDGVIDPAPTVVAEVEDYTNPTSKPWRADWCIVLPISRAGLGPNVNVVDEPVFMYPTPKNTTQTPYDAKVVDQRQGNKLSSPGSVVDDLSDRLWRTTNEGASVPWVPAVYHLGRYRAPAPSGMTAGDIRTEFRGEKVYSGTVAEETIAVDPYPTYSFAFTLQRARIDTHNAAGAPTPDGLITNTADQFTSSLYQVRVMVFKNFDDVEAYNLRPTDIEAPGTPADANAVVPRQNVPVREFVTLIAL
jgi:type II secretory pathway pseudopilin PulG